MNALLFTLISEIPEVARLLPPEIRADLQILQRLHDRLPTVKFAARFTHGLIKFAHKKALLIP